MRFLEVPAVQVCHHCPVEVSGSPGPARLDRVRTDVGMRGDETVGRGRVSSVPGRRSHRPARRSESVGVRARLEPFSSSRQTPPPTAEPAPPTVPRNRSGPGQRWFRGRDGAWHCPVVVAHVHADERVRRLVRGRGMDDVGELRSRVRTRASDVERRGHESRGTRDALGPGLGPGLGPTTEPGAGQPNASRRGSPPAG